jgi:hypothetical protein
VRKMYQFEAAVELAFNLFTVLDILDRIILEFVFLFLTN